MPRKSAENGSVDVAAREAHRALARFLRAAEPMFPSEVRDEIETFARTVDGFDAPRKGGS